MHYNVPQCATMYYRDLIPVSPLLNYIQYTVVPPSMGAGVEPLTCNLGILFEKSKGISPLLAAHPIFYCLTPYTLKAV